MVFEVDGGGVADLFVDGDGAFGDEAEDDEAVVGLLRCVGERRLGVAARLRERRESVAETLAEEF